MLAVTTLLAALMLSGCYRMDMTMKFNADDTVDGSMAFGMKKDMLDMMIGMSGQSEEDFWKETVSESGDETGPFEDAKDEPWSEGGYKGRKFTFRGVPVKDMNEESSTVKHVDGKFEVTLDMSEMNSLGDDAEGADEFGFGEMMEGMASPVLRFEFEFPGEIISAPGGTIKGNKVEFLYDSKEKYEAMPDTLTVTAKDSADGSSPAVLLVVGLLGLAAVVVGGLFFVNSRKGNGDDADGRIPAAQNLDVPLGGVQRESHVSPFASAAELADEQDGRDDDDGTPFSPV